MSSESDIPLSDSEVADLARAIDDSTRSARPLTTTAYRTCSYGWATREDVLSGMGAAKTGGRWNPVGIPAVYTSLSPHTALAEFLESNRRSGFATHIISPTVLVSIELRLKRVLDLNEPEVQDLLKVSQGLMTSADWKRIQNAGEECVTQTIGRLAIRAGFNGILAPTRLAPWDRGINAIVFPSHPDDGTSMRVFDQDTLPLRRIR